MADTATEKEARQRIGQGIIDGLLQPVGGVIAVEDYAQNGKGSYWQSSGGHVQSEGDYHQGALKE
jgi:hypothetical protein